MKTLLHISDLHFGRLHAPALDSLRSFILDQDKSSDLVIVSGDWTQRARRNQFAQAEKFLRQLASPVVSVPGNHDIPLYNLPIRFLNPLHAYRRAIAPLTRLHYTCDEFRVAGISTVNRWSVSGGILKKSELIEARDVFAGDKSHCFRVLVSHHPILEPEWPPRDSQGLRNSLWDLRPHLLLSGHRHAQSVRFIEGPNRHSALSVSAGSTTSNRLRGEENSLHILKLDWPMVAIQTYYLNERGFCEKSAQQTFRFA